MLMLSDVIRILYSILYTPLVVGTVTDWNMNIHATNSSPSPGDGKTGDATNFGIFKQNWMMLRQSASEFKGETAQQIDDGAILK